MHFTLALASALAGVAAAAPKAARATPAACSSDFEGQFEITPAQVVKQRSLGIEKRAQCGSNGVLVATLKDGVIKDSKDWTFYVADNYQLQFDNPPQAGSLTSSGFSICENNVLALGGNQTFYRCLSGTFYNLYTKDWAPQCEPVSLLAVSCGSDAGISQIPDGQVIATTLIQTTIITALPDGQPQVVTTQVPITVTSAAPVPTTTPHIPISESSDGQVQIPTGSVPPVVPTSATPPATTVVPPTPTTKPVTPIPSPAPSVSTKPVTPPAPSTTVAPPPPQTTTPPPTSGAAATTGSLGALVVGIFVAFLCL